MRINLIGGPGIGKSTLAGLIYAHYKSAGVNIELVREYVKGWAYSHRKILPYDQFYILAKQLQSEYIFLGYDVDHVVTDSPLWLPCFYGVKYKCPCMDELIAMVKQFDRDYPALNLMLNRGNFDYDQSGRYETLAQALQIDIDVRSFLTSYGVSFTVVDPTDTESIFKMIDSALSSPLWYNTPSEQCR